MTEYIKGVDEKTIISRTLFNVEKKLVFDPLVYEQRYLKTVKILSLAIFNNCFRNIVEFGSAELKIFTYLKNGLSNVRRIDLVDIDEELMQRFKSRIEPLIVEHMKRRPQKLTANVWKGNVAIPNPNFKDVDAVIALELIEHVFPDVLEEIPFHIFGIIKPKVAIFTTPNSEFNVLFDMPPGSFRHWDHKFEWTRAEFEDWANNICTRFPEYCVQFHGVGKAPEGREDLGGCSQLSFFIRKDFLESLDKQQEVVEEVDEQTELIECAGYKLIHTVDFPFFHDKRSRDEKILDECRYHINRFRWMEEVFFNYDANRYEIPITAIADACWEVTDNIEEIKSVIKDKFEMENDFLIFPPYEEEEKGEEDLES